MDDIDYSDINQGIITIELLDWPGDAPFASVVAIPFPFDYEGSGGNANVVQAALTVAANGVLQDIDWSLIPDTPPWEVIGIRLPRGELAFLPSETAMSVARFNGMLAAFSQNDKFAPQPFEIYDELVAAGCEIDNHESDLYVRKSDAAIAVLTKAHEVNYPFSMSEFISEGQVWFDLPFQYMPFWRERADKTTPKI